MHTCMNYLLEMKCSDNVLVPMTGLLLTSHLAICIGHSDSC